MAVLHTPIVFSLCYTTTSMQLPLTKLKFPNIPFSGCFFRPTTPPCLFLLRSSTTPLQKYVYPDPIPEFALHETKKFREELKKKLYKEKETFGSDFHTVLDTCTQLFGEFLAKEYGGPGTLLVEPFTDMLIELKQRKLPGANLAARASLLWAQNYLDHDWEIWNSKSP